MNHLASIDTDLKVPWVVEDKDRGIFSVRAKVYTDQRIFEAERASIFDHCWLYAAHESELLKNGDFLSREVGGRNLILVRGKDGRIRAFLNICRHKGGTVCHDRSGNAPIFRCIYHSWSYNNMGKLVSVSVRDGYPSDFIKDNYGLMEVMLDSYRGLIFITYNEQASSLKSFLSGAVEMLDLFLDQHEDSGLVVLPGAYEYVVPSNWKMLMENSMDVYHAFSVHHRYFNEYMPNIMGMKMNRDDLCNGSGDHVGVRDLGNGHSVSEYLRVTKNVDTSKRSIWERRHGVERTNRLLDYNRNLLIYPNTVLVEQFPMIRTHFPRSVDDTASTAWALVPAAEDPELREGRLAGFSSFQGPGGFGTPDDIEILSKCQKNCHAAPKDTYFDNSRGMTRAMVKPDDELQNRIFFKEWSRQLDLGPESNCSR